MTNDEIPFKMFVSNKMNRNLLEDCSVRCVEREGRNVKRYPVIFETTPGSFDEEENLSSYSFTIAQHSVVSVDTNDYNTNNKSLDSVFTI